MIKVARHSDGTWTACGSPTTLLYAIWGSGGRVYAVGAGGVVLRSDGGCAWNSEPTPTTNDLYGVWGSGLGDVYAVGAAGTILHTM